MAFPSGSTLNTGLVAAYKLNEKSGTNVIDHSGNGFNGTNNGATVKQPGVFDTCYGFDENQYVVESSQVAQINDIISIAFWMKAGTEVEQSPYAKPISTVGGGGWELARNNLGSNLGVRIDTSAGGGQSPNLTYTDAFDNNWHLIVLIINSGTVKGYLDGVSVGSASYNHGDGFASGIGDFFIGKGSGRFYKGFLSDVFIWNKELTADEVNELTHPYLKANSFPEGSSLNTGVVAHYKNWNNNIPNLVDYSGNGHHGEINGATYVNGVNKYGLDYSLDGRSVTPYTDHSNEVSICIRAKFNSLSGYPRLFDRNSKFFVWIEGNAVRFGRQFTGDDGKWDSNSTTLVTGEWYTIIITHDGTISNPTISINNIAQSIIVNTTPTGILESVSDALILGNHTSLDRNLDGIIEDFVIWDRLLTSQEITELQKPYKVFDYASTLDDNLVLSLDFEEMEGTTVFDKSGNGLHGVRSGSTQLQDGSYPGKRAYEFNSNEYCDIPHDPRFMPSFPKTFVVSFKRNLLDNFRYLLNKYNDLGLFFTGDDLYFRIYGSEGYSGKFTTGDLIDNSGWMYVIVYTDGSASYLGKSVEVPAVAHGDNIQGQLSLTPHNTTNDLRIGMSNGQGGTGFSGLVDRVLVWERELTTSEKSELDNFLKGIGGAIEVNLDHLQAGALLQEPIAKLIIDNELDLLNAGATLYEATVKRIINQQLDQLNAGMQIHDPDVKLIISQMLDQLDAGAQAHDVTAKRVIKETLELLIVGAQVYGVSVKNIISIALEYLTAGVSLINPETKLILNNELDHLQAGAQLHEPDIKRIITQSLELLQAGAQIHELELSGAIIIVLDHLAAGAQVIDPEIKLSIKNELETLQAGGQLQEPIVKLVISQILDLLQAGGQLYDVQARRVLKTTLEFLNAGASLIDPSVKLILKAELEKLEAGATMHEPVVKLIITETLESLTAGTQIHNIQAIRSIIVSLDHLIAGAIIVDPTVKLAIKEELDRLQAGAQALDPVAKLQMIAELETVLAGAQLHDIDLMVLVWEVLNLHIPLTITIHKELNLTEEIEKDFKFL